MGCLDSCRVLINDGKVAVDAKNMDQSTPLHIACGTDRSLEEHQVYVVVVLVEAGADKKLKDKNNMTPIDYARRNGWHGIVHYLTMDERQAEVGNQGPADYQMVFIS